MAGSSLERLQNQVKIFFTIKLNPSTPAGRNRLILFVLWIVLGLFVVSQFAGPSQGKRSVVKRAEFKESAGSLFDDDGGDDDEEGGDSLLEEHEDDEDDDKSGGDGDDEEDDDEGGGGGDGEMNEEALKDEQKQRLNDNGPEILKFFESYRKESDIHKHFTLLSDTYEPLNILKTKSIGNTYEKRDVRVYSLGKGKSGRSMMVISGEHGSEWPGPMALAYFVTRMVQLYGINADVTDLMNELTIYVVPIANPDGFSYTMTGKKERHWQKNRQKGKKGKGVDINRDWISMSQHETTSIRDFIKSRPGGLHGFVSVHCCSGNVILPLNQKCANTKTKEYQKQVARKMINSMSGKDYVYQLIEQNSKKSGSGFATNWFNNDVKVKLSYTLEGRGSLAKMKKKHTSEKKLVDVPVQELVEVSREITKGVVSLGTHIIREFDGSSNGCGGDAGESSLPGSDDDDAGDEESAADAADDDEDAGDDEESVADAADDDEDADGDAADDDDEDAGGDAEGDGDDEEEEDGTEIEGETINDDEPDTEVEGNTVPDDDDDANMHDEKETIADSDYDDDTKDTTPVKKTLKLESAIDIASKQANSAYLPALSKNQLPPADGSGPYFLYFAYGADMLFDVLLSVGVESAWKVVNAKLVDYSYDYTYYSKKAWRSGFADAFKHKHGSVWGVVYRVKKSEMKNLDKHNLVVGDRSYITNMTVSVTDKQGNVYRCRAYKVRNKMTGTDIYGKYRRFAPSRQYRNCVIKGAKQHRLPRDYIDRLRGIKANFLDKIGSSYYRNPAIGNVCDHERHR